MIMRILTCRSLQHYPTILRQRVCTPNHRRTRHMRFCSDPDLCGPQSMGNRHGPHPLQRDADADVGQGVVRVEETVGWVLGVLSPTLNGIRAEVPDHARVSSFRFWSMEACRIEALGISLTAGGDAVHSSDGEMKNFRDSTRAERDNMATVGVLNYVPADMRRSKPF